MIKFVNLTPFPVKIVGDYPRIEPSGSVAKLEETPQDRQPIDGIPTKAKLFGPIIGLPDPEQGTYYITSLLVALYAWSHGRQDVITPGEYLRNDKGISIGCSGFLVKPN